MKYKHTKEFYRAHPQAFRKMVLDTMINEALNVPPEEALNETAVKEIIRDAHGRLTKGHSGNLAGMPPGTPSLVRLLKKRLKDHPEDADAIVSALIKLGKDSDMRAIEQLLDRIDGKVAETHKIEEERLVTILFVPAEKLIENKPLEIMQGG